MSSLGRRHAKKLVGKVCLTLDADSHDILLLQDTVIKMAKQRHGKSRGAPRKANAAPGSRIKKMESYEDTLEEGGVDDRTLPRACATCFD